MEQSQLDILVTRNAMAALQHRAEERAETLQEAYRWVTREMVPFMYDADGDEFSETRAYDAIRKTLRWHLGAPLLDVEAGETKTEWRLGYLEAFAHATRYSVKQLVAEKFDPARNGMLDFDGAALFARALMSLHSREHADEARSAAVLEYLRRTCEDRSRLGMVSGVLDVLFSSDSAPKACTEIFAFLSRMPSWPAPKAGRSR